MPKAVHDLAIKLQSQGKSEDSAWAIANSQLSKTTKNDKPLGEMMQDQSPSMTNLTPSPQNTGTWPTSMTPNFGNQMSQMRENNTECDICGMPAHPPNDHPFLPRMPSDPMMGQQQMMPPPNTSNANAAPYATPTTTSNASSPSRRRWLRKW